MQALGPGPVGQDVAIEQPQAARGHRRVDSRATAGTSTVPIAVASCEGRSIPFDDAVLDAQVENGRRVELNADAAAIPGIVVPNSTVLDRRGTIDDPQSAVVCTLDEAVDQT